ncbi:MAG: SusC/RagA family TonB-linked outer membrane protein [Cytophagia bacterium]|nr:SusC/RagA family TonB-linked outer membrane protein [Cytophagia bacterium]
MKKILLLCSAMLFMLVSVRAQERTVTGRVTSTEDGSPLPGVNVVIKGTTNGTVTDANGNYKLSTPSSGGALIFSFVGLQTQEIEIGDRTVVDISLTLDVTQLTEVVVTAGGIAQNKRDLGYAIQSVNSEAVVESRQSNLLNGLSGKAAGVQITSSAGTPGAAAQIRIRGGSSISGSNDPLFVVDGIPVDNSSTGGSVDGVNQSNRLVDFNPNDVESITVLKGPAATVQYGIRGSNGVIIVTTKKGAKKQKATITVSSTTTVDRVNKLPEMQTSWAQGRNGVYRGPATGEATSWGPRISDLVFIPGSTSIYDKNGSLGLASENPGGRKANAYDNTGTFFVDGITKDNFISVAGGNDKSTVYASAGYLAQNGIVPNSTFQRYSFKLNADTKLNEKISVGAGAAYTQSGGQRIQQGSNLSGVMLGLLRTPPTFDNANGISDNPADNPASYTQPGIPATDPDNYQRSYRFNYDNPYWVVNKAPYRDYVNRFVGNLNATYKPTDWLSITARSGGDYFADFRKEVFDIGSKTNLVGAMNQDQISNFQVNHDVFANINKSIDKLEIFGTVGYNYFSIRRDRHRQASATMTIPGFFDISNFATTVNNNFLSRKKVVGVYGEARITWNEMIFLNFSARNDWSSTLPKANNSIFYPSVSLGFDVTQALLPENNNINYLKIRASYGSVGNDAPYYVTDNYFARFAYGDGWTDGLTAPILGQNAFATNGVLGNPTLKPELTSTVEFGVDGSFLGDRLTLDYTYYKTTNNDLILPAQIAASSGYYQTIVNTGTIERAGHEVVVGGTPVKLPNGFEWNISVNFTKYKAIVKELFGDLDRTQAGFSGFVNYAVKDEPFPSFYGTRFLRNDAGKVVVDASGLPIQDGADGALGSPIPDWQMGIRNSFSFKGITLSALLDIKQGGLIWNGTKGVLRGFGVSAATNDRTKQTIFPNSVFEDGAPNNVPIILGGQVYNRNYGFSGLDELNLEDGSYMRMRELSIGYSLPSSLIAKTKVLSGVSVSLVARNLFLITDYTGIDPETNLTGASNDFGEDYFNMPNTKSIGFNITLKL